MLLARTLVLGAVAAAAPATAASAGQQRVIRLAWNERALDQDKTVMTFQVRTLTIVGSRWTIDGSFRNTSKVRLRVRQEFALLYGQARTSVKGLKVLRAKSFRPALPTTLRPGQSWRGTFSGTGATALPKNYIRVQFSFFVGRAVSGRPGFGWITDHVARVN